MNTFKHKSLYAALAGLSALGTAGVAQAVSVNADGLGQALIYPYYTVRETALVGAPFNSLLSVVNSTASAKAVKVRFLEGKNSREVLDFNLYLSAKDVWTAAIIPTTDGAGIFTADKSCTTPVVSSSASSPSAFVNFAYSGSNDDKAGTSLDRTREGYVEIIEMGNVTGATAAAVTHASGVPACTPLGGASADTVPGNGGLFGGITLINVLKGEDFALDAVALEGFSAKALWNPAGSILPTLADVNPKTSVVVTGTNAYITDWTAGFAADPVSAVIMHNNLYNEFVLDSSTKSGTDWVVTFPTKREYYTGTTVLKLFQSNFSHIARYARDQRESPGADLAITIADDWQAEGLATHLLRALSSYAAQRGIHYFTVEMLADNQAIAALVRGAGGVDVGAQGSVVSARIPLLGRRRPSAGVGRS